MDSITKVCKVEGCDNSSLTRGYCNKHYQRLWRYGNTDGLRQNHGRANTPEWYSWKHMKQRCLRVNDLKYPHYGGRGIKVCERWLNKPYGFQNFLEDMGVRPSSKHSLGRIDNNGNYEPNNCRWESVEQQANNKSTSRLITFDGKTQTIGQWTKSLGYNKSLIDDRLRAGWSIERTLTVSPKH